MTHHLRSESDVLICGKSGEAVICSRKLPSMRLYVAFLSLVGCAIMYLTRVNLTVAILAMVNTTHFEDTSIASNYSELSKANNEEFQCPITHVESGGSETQVMLREFDWSPPEQGIVLGSFFYGNHSLYFTYQLGGGGLERLFEYRGFCQKDFWEECPI